MSELRRLGDQVAIAKGKPPAKLPFDGPGALPYLTPEYLRGQGSSVLAKPGAEAVVVADGDPVLLWDGSNAGEVFVGRAGIVASTMARLLPSPQFDRRYFAHVLKHLEPALKARTNGTGIPHVDREVLEGLKVRQPELLEQVRMAMVLDTLDTTIRQTEAIIEKLKQVKQGLLHDLLTRGMDANGELRPSQKEASELYRPSPLGWVPKGWQILQMCDLLAPVDPAMRSGPFGSALLKEELVSAGVPLLGIDNVHAERFVSQFSRFVTERKFNELSRYAVREHDLMITIMGTVGRCCTVPQGIGRALSSKHTWTLTLDQEKYLPPLAMLLVNYAPWVLRQFRKDEQGGTMGAIRSETLRSLLLPTPPIEEQREMVHRLDSISQRIAAETESVHKATLLKAGLMDDLLTGRVRVTPLMSKSATP